MICVFTCENGELKRKVRTKANFSVIEAGIQFTGVLKQLEDKNK